MWRERQQHTCLYVYLSVDSNVSCRWTGPVRSAHCVWGIWSARVSDGLVSRVMSSRWIDGSMFDAIQIQPALHHAEEECIAVAPHQVSSRRRGDIADHRRECSCPGSQDARVTHCEQSCGAGDEERCSQNAGHASWDKTKGQPLWERRVHGIAYVTAPWTSRAPFMLWRNIVPIWTRSSAVGKTPSRCSLTSLATEKVVVVKLIEAAASQLALPLTSDEGRNIY